MRADRVLSMLMLLQKNGRMTANELALELEVSERTIYRDMEALSMSGVPVFAERGPGGGIELLDSYRSDLTGLKKNEIRALFLLGSPSHLIDLGLDAEFKQAVRKLAVALPQNMADEEQRSRRFFIDPEPWEDTTTSNPLLSLLQIAVWEERPITITYRSILGTQVGTLKSTINPYGLAVKDNRWYLIGKREEDLIVLELKRMIAAEIEKTNFHYPDEFDLPEFWETWITSKKSTRPMFETTLEVLPAILSYLVNKYGRNLHEVDQEKPVTSGRVMINVSFSSIEEARSEILKFGRAIKVAAPKALQLSVEDFARQVVALYC